MEACGSSNGLQDSNPSSFRRDCGSCGICGGTFLPHGVQRKPLNLDLHVDRLHVDATNHRIERVSFENYILAVYPFDQ